MAEPVKLDDKYFDALKEVGNMGAGHASSALSVFVKKKVVLETPKIHLATTQEISSLIGGPKKMVVGIYNSIKGDATGTIILVLPTQDAMMLADVLQNKKPGTIQNLDKDSQTKLTEMGEILSKTYLKSVTDFLGVNITRDPERIVATFGQMLVDIVLLGVKGKYALFISTNFSIPDFGVSGKFILLLSVDSINKIIESIDKQLQ